MEEEFLTVDEVANFLKVARATIYSLKKNGLPYIKIGKNIRFPKSKVIQFMADREKSDK